jgi:DNA polymerase epsilon subunit 1
VFPLNESEFVQVQNILDIEIRTKKDPEFCANQAEYQKELKKRVKMYCQKSYKKTHISRAEVRRDTVCMRENSFYVDTVRDFRDRRYKFKADVKTEKGKYEKYTKAGDHVNAEQSKNLMVLY